MKITFNENPIPAPRPRVVRGHAYNDPNYTTYKEAFAWEMRKQKKQYTGDVYVTCEFFRKDARRCDIDNLLKSVFDALQLSGTIPNDNLITAVHAVVYYKQKEPRTELEVLPAV